MNAAHQGPPQVQWTERKQGQWMSLQFTALHVQHRTSLPQSQETDPVERFTIELWGYDLHDDELDDRCLGTLTASYIPAACLQQLTPSQMLDAVPALSLLGDALFQNPHMTPATLATYGHGLLYIQGVHIDPEYQRGGAGTSLLTLALQRLQRTLQPERFGVVLLAVPMDRSPAEPTDDPLDPDHTSDPLPQHNPDPDQPEIRWGDWYRIADFNEALAQQRQEHLIRWYTRMGFQRLGTDCDNALFLWNAQSAH